MRWDGEGSGGEGRRGGEEKGEGAGRRRTEFDFGLVGEQHVLALDVAVDDLAAVQMLQALQRHKHVLYN